MSLGKKIYFYSLLFSAIFKDWIKQPNPTKARALELFSAYKAKDTRAFSLAMRYFVIPNFRLSVKIKLGRPSPTVFRKFFNEFKKSESLVGRSAAEQYMPPQYLIIRDGAMGDVLMLTPVIRELYKRHGGDIDIDIATLAASVFENNPYVRQVLTPKDLNRGIRTYDVVADLNGVYERFPNVHPVITYAKFMLGDVAIDQKLDLHPTQADISFIDQVIDEIDGPYVVVHHFKHEWPNREIDLKIWTAVLSCFIGPERPKVIYVGIDRDYADILGPSFEDHRNRYSIQQLSLLISKSQAFFGGDSGPSHIAATTNAAMCVFYTCASHEARMPLRDGGRFLPIFPQIDCYGCLTRSSIPRSDYFCERGDNACVRAFDEQEVKRQVLAFIHSA
jgi:ADP-heptose:LPS heptosyltransferase